MIKRTNSHNQFYNYRNQTAHQNFLLQNFHIYFHHVNIRILQKNRSIKNLT